MYAVSIAGGCVRSNVLAWNLLVKPLAGQVVEPQADAITESAVVLDCDEERAAAVVALIRMRCKRAQWHCWYSKTGNGGWKAV